MRWLPCRLTSCTERKSLCLDVYQTPLPLLERQGRSGRDLGTLQFSAQRKVALSGIIATEMESILKIRLSHIA